ncbi:MAG: alpha/beta hydrolase domain-containing protein [Acetobacteraceae bacterium]
MTDSPGSVLRLEVAETISPVFGGAEFGTVGAYESISGTAHGALDPAHPLNAGIVNLDRAPRNAAGLVEYSSEFCLIRPRELSRGNGWLLYDVVNRGNKIALVRLNYGADGNRPTTREHAGDGFLMRRGFSLLWSAWQTGVPAGMDRLNAQFPVAANPDGPIVGTNRDEFIAEGLGGPGDLFIQETSETSFIGTLSYPAANLDPSRASLTVRLRERDPRVTPPGLAWRYVDARHVEITRAPGFDRGAIYEFIYPARDPAVMGIGFAAIRDLVAHMRHAPDSLLSGSVRHAAGFGISQSGRVLRDFVHLGFNQDLSGRTVFDGIMPIVGGSRRTFINHAFAQPGRYSRQHEDHSYLDDQFPFTYPTLTDPISGKTDGILARANAAGVCPKVMHLDADSDIWAARASLVATDTQGNDAAMPDNVRLYLASGTQHAVYKPEAKHAGELPGNPLGYSAWMRALLVALVEWVEKGTTPPSSRFPSGSAGTLVTREEAQAQFPRLHGVTFPSVLNALHLRDHSVEPPIEGPEYPVFVVATDADGNSRDGLRHPLLTAPLATHTGWSVRVPGYAAGDLFTVQGSIIPFAETEAARAAAGDPRPSVEARYGSREAWAARVVDAAESLVAERLLLREDADRLIQAVRGTGNVFAVL